MGAYAGMDRGRSLLVVNQTLSEVYHRLTP